MAKRRREARSDDEPETERSRLDRWLWAARFFKTRALAAEAIDGGKVTVNEDRPKRARPVEAGDLIRIRFGPVEQAVRVLGLSARRGPAQEAALLYEETPESLARRAEVHARLKAEAAAFSPQTGRPTKRDRRDLIKRRWKG